MQESRALGRFHGRVKVYKLQTICQLAADRQERANEDHETEFVRYGRPASLRMRAGSHGNAANVLKLAAFEGPVSGSRTVISLIRYTSSDEWQAACGLWLSEQAPSRYACIHALLLQA